MGDWPDPRDPDENPIWMRIEFVIIVTIILTFLAVNIWRGITGQGWNW